MKFSKQKLWDIAARCGFWTVVVAVTFWSFNRDEWISSALAGTYVQLIPTATSTTTEVAANGVSTVIVTVSYKTVTGTTTDASTGPTTSTLTGTNTNTNCATGGTQYGGGQWNWCNSTDPAQQQNSQNNTQNLNNNGAQESTMLGMAAIAAGMAMVAAGVAMMANPPTAAAGAALVAAGMMLIMAGMAALAAASQMNKNGNTAGTNAANLSDLGQNQSSITTGLGAGTDTSLGTSAATTSGTTLGSGGPASGIQIDPALLRTGTMDGIMGNMEQQTGLNRNDLASALSNGQNPLGLLANAPALANSGATQDSLQKMMDSAAANNPPLSADQVMDKLGLTQDDLVGNGGGGADPNRKLASSSGPNLDALFPTSDKPAGANGLGSKDTNLKVSSEIQDALDKHGITSRNLFEMVHSQYVKKTPLLFGVKDKTDLTKSNPFAGLGSDKVDP